MKIIRILATTMVLLAAGGVATLVWLGESCLNTLQLREAGWIAAPLHPEEHREWCRTISSRIPGIERTGSMLAPE